MAGFHGCRWCQGRGCLACGDEQRKWEKGFFGTPMFTAKIDSPEEMAEMNEIFSGAALEKAFGPNGDGMAEIEQKSAITMLMRELRKRTSSNVEFSGVPAGHSSNHPAGGTSAGTQG